MHHLNSITRVPQVAQTANPLCSSPTSDFQVKLCFLVSILTDFFLPVYTLKVDTGDGTEPADDGATE